MTLNFMIEVNWPLPDEYSGDCYRSYSIGGRICRDRVCHLKYLGDISDGKLNKFCTPIDLLRIYNDKSLLLLSSAISNFDIVKVNFKNHNPIGVNNFNAGNYYVVRYNENSVGVRFTKIESGKDEWSVPCFRYNDFNLFVVNSKLGPIINQFSAISLDMIKQLCDGSNNYNDIDDDVKNWLVSLKRIFDSKLYYNICKYDFLNNHCSDNDAISDWLSNYLADTEA